MSALELFEAGQPDGVEHFHWYDIFTVCQDPAGQAAFPPGYFKSTFKDGERSTITVAAVPSARCGGRRPEPPPPPPPPAARAGIVAIGHTLLVLSPWAAPIPLRRSWCLWGIPCTIEAGAAVEFSVQLSVGEEADFILAVAGDWKAAQAALTAVDGRPRPGRPRTGRRSWRPSRQASGSRRPTSP